MEPPFAIEGFPIERLLTVKLSGYWSLETVREFQKACNAEIARLKVPPGRPSDLLALVDCRSMAVQPQHVVCQLTDVVAQFQLTTRKSAVIVASALQGMQAARIAPNHSSRMFTEMDPAREWLMAEQRPDL